MTPNPGTVRRFSSRLFRLARLGFALSWIALFASTGAQAQSPTLVKDIFPGSSSSAYPEWMFDSIIGVSGDKAFLRAISSVTDERGIWVTDGTVTGTRLLLSLGWSVSGIDVAGEFFFITDTVDGAELWKTNGTTEGTVFISQLGETNPSTWSGDGGITTAGGRMFFTVENLDGGQQLWSSDGTAAGTKMVKDITPGPDSIPIGELTGIGSSLYFSAGDRLWKSDGTEAGTVPVSDVIAPESLTNLNGTLYFAGTDPVHGSELWKSDGTPGGTVLVRDILPGTASSSPQSLLAFGGAIYFRLESDGSMWRSDGTEAGTTLFRSLPSTPPFVVSGNRFFFTANESQLWASDGTSAGTVLIGDLGEFLHLNSAMTVPGALLFWRLSESWFSANGIELWRSDGTPEGTALVKVVEPGMSVITCTGSASTASSTFHLLYPGIFLWRSDGTPEGTVRLHGGPGPLPNDGAPYSLIDSNGTVFCAAADGEHGRELWRSDGTPDGTSLVSDVTPGPASSTLSLLLAAPSTVLLTAATGGLGYGVYGTDGTGAGTVLARDLGRNWDPFRETMGILGSVFLFISEDVAHGMEPWRSDGTPSGTYLLGDLTPGATSSELWPLGVLKDACYFTKYERETKVTTLWRTDGTVAGTVAVGPIPTGGMFGVAVGDVLVFVGGDAEHGIELWKTDGTAAGTSLLRDINPAGDLWPYFGSDDWGYTPPQFILERVGNKLLFWADDGVHGIRPWVTDGTSAGTTLLKDIQPYLFQPYLRIDGTALLGSNRYFWAYDGTHGFELWKTDGTSAGTVLVRDITPGAVGSLWGPHLVAAGHEVFFTASDHVSGAELWRTDGTEAGTRLVADLYPGAQGSAPRAMARSGGKLFFSATDGTTGYELWSLPVPLKFYTIAPCRVADTREPTGPTGGAPLGASETAVLQVTGRCGIPSTAVSVAANVTVVNPSATGSLSIFAGGPVVSGSTEVPATAGRTRALHFVPMLGTNGSLSVRAGLPPGSSTDVVLDVSGWFE